MRSALKTPPVDLNEIYVAINASGFSDPRYHAANFGRQPCRKIFKVLEMVLRRERQQANAMAYTTARVGMVVQVAASMGKATSELEDWLPYRQENPDGRPRLAADAAATLRQLIQRRALPMPVIAFLMEDLKSADVLN